MKRSPRTRSSCKKTAPTPVDIRRHIDHLLDAQQVEWHYQLLSAPAPDWTRLMCLHLQMVELAGIEAGMQEFF